MYTYIHYYYVNRLSYKYKNSVDIFIDPLLNSIDERW